MERHGSVRQSPIALSKRNATKKRIRLFLWVAFTLFMLLAIVVVGISTYVGWSLTHPDRKPLDADPSQYGLTYSEFEVLSSFDQTKLLGWTIEASQPAQGIMIMAHGYRNNRLEDGVPALALAQDFAGQGYHVIMFDFRNSGASDGKLTSVGYHEKHDLLSIIRFAKEQYPELPIGLMGFSMGATTSIIAAAEEEAVRAVIADSPFADLRTYLEDNLSYWSDLPEFPFTPTIMTIIPILTGIDPDGVSPRESIKSMSTPVLLIHGDGDIAIPVANSEEILQNSRSGVTSLWVPSGSGHVGGYKDHPEEYREKVFQFLAQHMKLK